MVLAQSPQSDSNSGLMCRPSTTVAIERAPARRSAIAADCALAPVVQVSSRSRIRPSGTGPARNRSGSSSRTW